MFGRFLAVLLLTIVAGAGTPGAQSRKPPRLSVLEHDQEITRANARKGI